MHALAREAKYNHCGLFARDLGDGDLAERAAKVQRGSDIRDSAAALAVYNDRHLKHRRTDGSEGKGAPSRKENHRGQVSEYGGDADPRVRDPTLMERYEAYLNPPLRPFSRNGSDPALSDIRVAAGKGAVTVLAVLHVLVDSGYLRGSSGWRCRRSRFGCEGFVSREVTALCTSSRLVKDALVATAVTDESLRDPVVWGVGVEAPQLAEYDSRAWETSLLMVRLGCSFFVLLRWLDVRNQAYLESSRQGERTVSFAGTTLARALTRQDEFGAPSFVDIAVTGDMKRGSEGYNAGGPPRWNSRNHKSTELDRGVLERTLGVRSPCEYGSGDGTADEAHHLGDALRTGGPRSEGR